MYKVGQFDSNLNINPTSSTEIPWISIDDPPDLLKHPLFIHASPLKVVVEAGDVLYLPSMWYHGVTQLGDDDGKCVAVNYWYDMQFDARYCWLSLQDKAVADQLKGI